MTLMIRTKYALVALIDLAKNEKFGKVTMEDIATRQGLSLSVLQKAFHSLKNANLIMAARGPGGGYSFVVPPSRLTMKQILNAVGEPLEAIPSDSKSETKEYRSLLRILKTLNVKLDYAYSKMTLEDFL